MSIQPQCIMTGNMAVAPYQRISWSVYGQPATDDSLSGFAGQLDTATIKLASIVPNPALSVIVIMTGALIDGGTVVWKVLNQPDNDGSQSDYAGLLNVNSIHCSSLVFP